MGIFNSEYTIEANKSVDDTKALFEKYFKDISTVGYSMSTVIMNSDYGRKKFTGSVSNDGVYSARLINANGTDALYRSSLLNKITFSGDSFHTKVNVFVSTAKFGIMFIMLIVIALLFCALSLMSITYGEFYGVLLAVGAGFLLLSFIPLLIARHRVNAAKEELIYILKYSDDAK